MSKIIPIINGDKGNINITESNLPILSSQNSKNLTPILNNNDDLILEMNGIGPMGPKGERGDNGEDGNGILYIEKTRTEGITDYYTIYFTNGTEFEYSIQNGVIYYYEGPYDVIPMPNTTQILPTANLAMSTDINVHEIPYQEVTNLSGGITATIGDIN